jgi:hypothetical protein
VPLEAKPLFRPDVLRSCLAGFALPATADAMRPKLAKWAVLLKGDKADKLNEQEILPDFLTCFFVELLGYAGPAEGGERWTLSREKHVQVGGKFADAVLGDFRHAGDSKFIVAFEGKGPKDPLDRPFAGRQMSAVDQAYRYAINLPCDWILVTSIRQTRLYYKGSDQQTYERFDTAQLAVDDALLKKFVYLLGAARVVLGLGRCHLYDLLASSEKVGRELTKAYYIRYADMRQEAFEHLCRENRDIPRPVLLSSTQKLLDRVLFCAFCEDRGLLPADTIGKAYQHSDPYNPRPVWENFRGLFNAINVGNEKLNINGYNGGLFAADATLDRLRVPDAVCQTFRELAAYDYRPASEVMLGDAVAGIGSLIDVDILGHIFEQSITDLEKLRDEVEGKAEPAGLEKHKSRRKKEGAFYTPAFITRYIVEQALGSVVRHRFEQLRLSHQYDAKGTARAALDDPNAFDLEALKKPQRDALTRFWESWQDELVSIRLLDPACGSGAFLIEAFDHLHRAYQFANDRLTELRGSRLFDPDRTILEKNLYGVDLNEEAVEICRLSLWIKTAAKGKPLTSLDHTIRVGNSVVSDPAFHPKACDWKTTFPEVTAAGGFDVVVGNPPYVRQEMLSPIKPYLETAYKAYHGMADLYVYFYELGMRQLKPGGRLSFVVTYKWMKAGYGEPLRRFFGEETWIESVVDFGHAKQIFEDADVFPSIIVARKPTDGAKPTTARLCTIPREQLRIDDLSLQIDREGAEISLGQLSTDGWQLELPAVSRLLGKIRACGVPLSEFVGARPLMGIKTGFNDAFLMDTPTKESLLKADPKCAAIIKPYVRGQDIKRWNAAGAGLWMIALKSSGDHSWPWSHSGDNAESVFQKTYPSIHAHMKPLEDALRKRQDQGRNWWELRSCAYWAEFDKPKIVYQEIQFHPSYALDTSGRYGNNKTFFVATGDLYLLCVLNSPLLWWHNWRYLPHMKDEALTPVAFLMETLPIARPTDDMRGKVEKSASRLIECSRATQETQRQILDWLLVEHEIDKPSMKLQAPLDLDSDAFVGEVKKLRGKKKPLTAAALKSLRVEYTQTLDPVRALAAEALTLETKVSHLVNDAYGLTPEEIALMWGTAPPRMPIPRPI